MNSPEMKVLIVEEDPGTSRWITEALEKEGKGKVGVLVEPTLPGALQQVSHDGVDLVLFGFTQDEEASRKALAQIHQTDTAVPIIALTHFDDEIRNLEVLRLGAQDYFPKEGLNGAALVRALFYARECYRFRILVKPEPLAVKLGRSLTKLRGGIRGTAPEERQAASVGVDLESILEHESVESFFQPWVSLRKQSIVGFEGLCRGVADATGRLISPSLLLTLAARGHRMDALDGLFRKKVMEGFREAAHRDPDLVLSVNYDPSLLDDVKNGFDDFLMLASKYGLDPRHISVEILESHAHDLARLKQFIEVQREAGFLIALDDIGVGYSNLDRIAELKPDIIKADRSLVMDLDKNYHKQEVFKSLVKLSHGLGALLVAEGAETEMETLVSLELGADMIQGYYFAKPERMGTDVLRNCGEKIDESSKKFKSFVLHNLNEKRARYRSYDRMVSDMADQLATITPRLFDLKLESILTAYPEVVDLFILDEGGTQMSKVVYQPSFAPREKALFKTPVRGSDHSLKDYYYNLLESDMHKVTYVTEPYLSLATGELCVAISTLFKDGYGHTNVLCVDMKPESIAGA